MKPDIERECVRRLLLALGHRDGDFTLESPNPPAPDVRVCWHTGRGDAVEVTEVHPDEVPGRGSGARAEEERRAIRNPHDTISSWNQTNAMPALCYRVDEKVGKSAGYARRLGEEVFLLLVAASAMPGAVASTTVAWPLLNVSDLNRRLHAALCTSRFERAYLHLQLWHGLWEWSRPEGWSVRQRPCSAGDGSETLELLRQHAGRRLLPGSEIVGRWP